MVRGCRGIGGARWNRRRHRGRAGGGESRDPVLPSLEGRQFGDGTPQCHSLGQHVEYAPDLDRVGRCVSPPDPRDMVLHDWRDDPKALPVPQLRASDARRLPDLFRSHAELIAHALCSVRRLLLMAIPVVVFGLQTTDSFNSFESHFAFPRASGLAMTASGLPQRKGGHGEIRHEERAPEVDLPKGERRNNDLHISGELCSDGSRKCAAFPDIQRDEIFSRAGIERYVYACWPPARPNGFQDRRYWLRSNAYSNDFSRSILLNPTRARSPTARDFW